MVKATKRLNWTQIPCCAHRMNLVVKASFGVQVVADAKDKVKTLVTRFKKSAPLRHSLESNAEALSQTPEGADIGDKRKLVQEVPTRWNSAFEMIQRVLDLKPALQMVSVHHQDVGPMLPTPEEWSTLGDMVAILRPFKRLTEDVSGSHYVTSTSAEIVMKNGIRENLILDARNESAAITAMKKAMKGKLDEIEKEMTSDTCQVLRLSTFLNPDLRGFFHDQEKRTVHQAWMKSFFKKDDIPALLLEFGKQRGLLSEQPDQPFHQDEMLPPAKKLKLQREEEYNHQFSKRAEMYGALYVKSAATTDDSDLNSMRSEVEAYLTFSMKTEENRKGVKPEIWWKRHHIYFPQLSPLARCLMGIPSTSVPSEQLFSQVKQIVTDKRQSLHHDTAEILAVLHGNSEYLLPQEISHSSEGEQPDIVDTE